MIRVYPPGRSATFSAMSRKSSLTAYLLRKAEKTTLRLWVVSLLALVISGSTNFLSALAFATVVLIRLCSIKEDAILAIIAFR